MDSVEQKKHEVLEIQGKAKSSEIGAMGCVIFMLVLFTYMWVRYQFEMLVAIIPLIIIGTYLVLFSLIPCTYVFTESAIEIRQRFQKTVIITYENVFNCSSTAHDNFLNITTDNQVTIYFEKGIKKKKQSVICTPRDVETFVSTLKARCPVFSEGEDAGTSLDVFLKS